MCVCVCLLRIVSADKIMGFMLLLLLFITMMFSVANINCVWREGLGLGNGEQEELTSAAQVTDCRHP